MSSRTLAHWYPRLAVAVEAGLGLTECVETIPGPATGDRVGLAASLRDGQALADALEGDGAWLPAIDRQVITAGADSGRLPEALRRLAARHEAVTRAQVGIGLALIYPLALLHFGALAFPIQTLINESLGAYAASVAKVLIPLWGLGAAAYVAVRANVAPVQRLLDVLPLIGGFRRTRALADLAFLLEALLGAGTRPDVAWLRAAVAAGDRRLEPVAIRAAESVQAGQPVSPVLAGQRAIPALFAEYYRSGEATGRMDQSLQAIQRHFSESAATKLRLAGMGYAALVLVAVMGWVAARIVLFYLGYFRQYEQLMQ